MEHIEVYRDTSLQDLWHHCQHVWEPPDKKRPNQDGWRWLCQRGSLAVQQSERRLCVSQDVLEWGLNSWITFMKLLKPQRASVESVTWSLMTRVGLRTFSVEHVVRLPPHVEPSAPVLHHHQRFPRLQTTQSQIQLELAVSVRALCSIGKHILKIYIYLFL